MITIKFLILPFSVTQETISELIIVASLLKLKSSSDILFTFRINIPKERFINFVYMN